MHEDAFASIADEYDAWYEMPLGMFVESREFEVLAKLLGPLDSGKVLEVGAGTGRLVRLLADRGFTVAALEPSPMMRSIGEGATADCSVDWYEGHGEQLPFPALTFDGACIVTTIEFVRDTAQTIHETLRVIRGGGWLLVGILHALSPWTALYRHEGDAGVEPWHAARFYTPDELEALVGFQPTARAGAVWLAPGARSPFGEADASGRRAGNAPAFEAMLWSKPV